MIMATNENGVLRKNWLTAFILSLLLGGLGADRFYLGKIGTGILKLITFGGLGIWALIDFIMIATKNVSGVVWENDNKDAQKKAWVTFAVVMVIALTIGFNGASNSTQNDTASKTQSTESAPVATNKAGDTAAPAPAATPKIAPAPAEPSVPVEYKSALNKGTSYATRMHMSKQGVYDQLVSEYGEQFSAEAAQYAIDNVKADWNANALAKAKSYQDQMSMSPAAIHDQLTSEYGEKFTAAEADYAIEHLND